jgi:hypothetical protein
MATEIWGDGSEGYDSLVPIQYVLDHIQSKFKTVGNSISYGKKSARFYFHFDPEIKKINKKFSIFKLFSENNALFESYVPSVEELIKYLNKHISTKHIHTSIDKGQLHMEYLTEEEMKNKINTIKIQNKLKSFG